MPLPLTPYPLPLAPYPLPLVPALRGDDPGSRHKRRIFRTQRKHAADLLARLTMLAVRVESPCIRIQRVGVLAARKLHPSEAKRLFWFAGVLRVVEDQLPIRVVPALGFLQCTFLELRIRRSCFGRPPRSLQRLGKIVEVLWMRGDVVSLLQQTRGLFVSV